MIASSPLGAAAPYVLLGILVGWLLGLLICVFCRFWMRFWYAADQCNYQGLVWTVAWNKACRRYP